MSVILEQIAKADRRAAAINLAALVSDSRDKVPRQLADARQIDDRRQFLRQSLGDIEFADRTLERIIAGNELQDVNYLPRGAIAARAVARIEIRQPTGRTVGYGTGFLIAPNVLLTNHHVLPDRATASRSLAQFDYQCDVDGHLQPAVTFELLPDELFHADQSLDFAVVAVRDIAATGDRRLQEFGALPLVGRTGKVADGEWLTIVQHPGGERKQLCARENKLLKRTDDVLWYSTDTVGGSSGSPVFNNDWYVVALHHSGVPERRGDTILNIDGSPYDALLDPDGKNIKWQANEGIRVSRIVEHLARALPDHPQIRLVLAGTVEAARVSVPSSPITLPALAHPPQVLAATVPPSSAPSISSSRSAPMPQSGNPTARTLQVTLAIDEGGHVSVVDSGPRLESTRFTEASKKPPSTAKFDVPFDADYSRRLGFQADFLGTGHEVHLPSLSPALSKAASKLLDAQGKVTTHTVLHYHNYSLVMHAARRFAIYTAANVRADQRYNVGRPTDVWRTDPRIPIEHQVTDFYYKSNQFDRGHLTRREDLEFGKTLNDAFASAADTCHWTNCTPQHAKFNQNKELWQGIERYLLEGAIKTGKYHTQVFTGPILDEDDPVYERVPGIQYPVRFWKVVATVDRSDQLFATAYLLDQSDVIAQYGIEATEVPFGAYKTFQVRIDEIERLTGLHFTYGKKKAALTDLDPLATAAPRASRRGARLRESVEQASAPEGYVPLSDLGDIVLA